MNGEWLGLLPVIGAGLGLVGARPIVRLVAPDHKQPTVSELLPWSHIDPEDLATVHLVRGGAFRVVELGGTVYSGQKEAAIRAVLAARASFWLGQRHRPVRVRVITRKVPVAMPAPLGRSGFLGRLDRVWHEQMKDASHITHHMVISVEKKGQIGRLDGAVSEIRSKLADYKPVVLTNTESEALGGASPLLSFLASLVTDVPAFVRPTAWLHEAVSVAGLSLFKDGRIYSDDGVTRRRVQVIGVRGWGEETTPEIVSRIMRLPYSISTMLNVETEDGTKGRKTAERRHKQSNAVENGGNRKTTFNALMRSNQEWEKTIQEVAAEEIALHQVELFIYLNTAEADADAAYMHITEVLGPKSVEVIRERRFATRAFWARLPGYDYFTRGYPGFRSPNVADLTPFEAEPRGYHKCGWGPRPLRYLPNAGTRAPYGFITQVDDKRQSPPHVAWFAPTGKGKTVSQAFMLAGGLSSYPDLSALAFDKDNGLRVFTEAVGGQYLLPGTAELPLNPFDRDDKGGEDIEDSVTQQIERLLEVLGNANPDDDKAVKEIAFGVKVIMGISRQKRVLADCLHEAFPDGPIRRALETWCGEGRYGQIFNGKTDAFSPGRCRLTTVAMDGMDSDPRLAAALTYYFSQRVTAEWRGKPHIVWVDEAGQLLEIDGLALQVRDLLRTVRKNEGAVWLTFQEVGALDRLPHGLKQTIRTNCRTNVYWPGTAATADELDGCNMTKEEIAFVTGAERLFENAEYPVLIKRDNESVFVDLNISGIGSLIKVFYGGTGPALNMAACMREDGEKWLESYLLR